MPYIKEVERGLVENGCHPKNCGELNYLLTKIIHTYVKKNRLKYQILNEVIGVLECAKASLVETVLIPYEKQKMKQNGSISNLDKDYEKKL